MDIIFRHNNITDGAITFALDGKTAMEESRGDWPLSIDQKCFDYLQVIRKWIKLSPLTITFWHVKGHQMKELEYHQLDWWGQRNEDVDGAAKAFLRQCTSGPQRDRRVHNQPILHLEQWALAHDGTKLTSIYRDALYNKLYGPRTIDYWVDKDDIPKDETRILWEESLQAMKRVSRAHCRIDTKLLSNHCGFEKTKFDR